MSYPTISSFDSEGNKNNTGFEQCVTNPLRGMVASISLCYKTNLKGKTQGNMHNVLGQAPKLHLPWVQHIPRLRNKPVSDLYIDRHLLEAKVQIVHVVATPRHEGMDVIFTLIIPVCIGD